MTKFWLHVILRNVHGKFCKNWSMSAALRCCMEKLRKNSLQLWKFHAYRIIYASSKNMYKVSGNLQKHVKLLCNFKNSSISFLRPILSLCLRYHVNCGAIVEFVSPEFNFWTSDFFAYILRFDSWNESNDEQTQQTERQLDPVQVHAVPKIKIRHLIFHAPGDADWSIQSPHERNERQKYDHKIQIVLHVFLQVLVNFFESVKQPEKGQISHYPNCGYDLDRGGPLSDDQHCEVSGVLASRVTIFGTHHVLTNSHASIVVDLVSRCTHRSEQNRHANGLQSPGDRTQIWSAFPIETHVESKLMNEIQLVWATLIKPTNFRCLHRV